MPVPARKHRSCDSALEATGSPASAASARTSGFVRSPSGNRSRASVRGRHRREHVGLILGRIGGGAQQPVLGDPRVVPGRQRGGADAVGELEHRVEPHVAVAAHARVRRLAARVGGQERVDDAGPELGPQVEREVRQAHPVRDRAGDPDRVRRAARRLGVVGLVGPQLERHRGGVRADQQRRDRGVHPAAHRDERAVRARDRGTLADGDAERAVQRVGREVGGVELARRQPAELLGDRVRADPRGVEHVGAGNERHHRRPGRGHRPAAGRLEPGGGHPLARDGERDADQVTARRAAGRAVECVRRALATPGGMLQVLAEGLHER